MPGQNPQTMATFLVIISIALWLAAMAALFLRPIAAPAASYAALLCLSFASRDGIPLLPIGSNLLWGWLAITVVVIMSMLMQTREMASERRGMGYMAGGALTGLAVGLLGFTSAAGLGILYGIMVISVAAGVFLGFLLFTRTPRGRSLAPGSGHFFRYLLAKGFPAAITVMQAGIALVLTVALHQML